MRTTLLTLCQVTVFLLVATPGRAVENSPPVPGRFNAHIGGFMGAFYAVELHGDALIYTSFESGHRNQKQAKVTPTAAEWRVFRQTLDDLQLWQWRSDYPSQGTVDGTQWSLEIAYADHSLKTQGSNSYPDASGKPNGNPDPTKTFNRYLAAIKKLIGGRSFE